MKNTNGDMRLNICSRKLTKEDLSMITIFDGRRVWVQGCLIEDIDVKSLNPNINFVDCLFINSEVIIPNPNKQLANCIFDGSEGIKRKRHQIRPAVTTLGYYSPVITK